MEFQVNKIEHLTNSFSHTAMQVNQVHELVSIQERTTLMNGLSTQPYYAHHQAQHNKVMENNGAWMLQHQSFVAWQRSSSSSLLWLHGPIGYGKSCLTCVHFPVTCSSRLTRLQINCDWTAPRSI